MAVSAARRANIAGLGLIGGSIARALTERGWTVSGDDHDPERCAARAGDGCRSAPIGLDPDAEVTFVATPVLTLVDQVKRALGRDERPGHRRRQRQRRPRCEHRRRPVRRRPSDGRQRAGRPRRRRRQHVRGRRLGADAHRRHRRQHVQRGCLDRRRSRRRRAWRCPPTVTTRWWP